MTGIRGEHEVDHDCHLVVIMCKYKLGLESVIICYMSFYFGGNSLEIMPYK